MKQKTVKEILERSKETKVLILAFAELEWKFRDNTVRIGDALYNLKQKSSEYERLLKRIKVPIGDGHSSENNLIHSALHHFPLSVISHQPFYYSLGPNFKECYETAKQIAISEGFKESLLEQFAKDFKEELIKLGGYKK